MSNTLKQRKYYAITTKTGKRIPAQRTIPDEVIYSPLQVFVIDFRNKTVRHVASQSVFPVSKHTTNALLIKEAAMAIAGIPLENIVVYAAKARTIRAIIRHLEGILNEHL